MSPRKRIIGLLFCTMVGWLTVAAFGRIQGEPELVRNRALVRQVQQTLADKGYPAGPVDGIMGPQTRQALRRFQEDENLEVNGRMTEETLARLGVEAPPAGSGDRPGRGGVAGAVGSAGKAAAKGTAAGATAGAEATAKGSKVAAKSTAKGATVAAKSTARGSKAAAQGAAAGAEATGEGAATGAKAVAGGVQTGAKTTASGAKSVARGTRKLLFGKDEDDRIRERVIKAFKNDPAVNPDHFDVRVKDGIVTLRFKKGTSREWNRAVVVARRVEGVRQVHVRKPR